MTEMKAVKRKETVLILSTIATNLRFVRIPISSPAHSSLLLFILLSPFISSLQRERESAYYVPLSPSLQLKDYNLRCQALENLAPWARKKE